MQKFMKAMFSCLLVFLVVGTLAACGNNNDANVGIFNPGTYEGTGQGFGGEISAIVTVTSDEITDIELNVDSETAGFGDSSAEKLTDQILSTQSLAVEVVSGATYSSEGIIDAITEALEEAGADIAALQDPENKIAIERDSQEDLDVDIAVVGSGGAGLAAAIEAAEAGKSVVVLERMPIIGGNTNRATGGMNAAGTTAQAELDIEDSVEVFYEDAFRGGQELNDPELLRVLVDNAAEAVEWVNELGAGLTDVIPFGGQTNNRTHRPEGGTPAGPAVVEALSNRLEELEVDVLVNTTVVNLIEEDGKVTGLEATDSTGEIFTVNAEAVILATGGFGANPEMILDYREDLEGFHTTNHAGATGSGIRMAEAIGADLVDMIEIQTHPTTDPETGYMFTEAIRGNGGILINAEGERFVNELDTRDVVSKAIVSQSTGQAFLVVNDAIVENNASLARNIENGFGVQGETIEELAEAMGVDPEALRNTMEAYTSFVEAGEDQDFQRASLIEPLAEGTFYAIPVIPSIHHTMGGVRIDTEARVLNTDGEPIQGLFAAGEVTGGIHGTNRLGGNALADIIVFGRIAGQTAAANLK